MGGLFPLAGGSLLPRSLCSRGALDTVCRSLFAALGLLTCARSLKPWAFVRSRARPCWPRWPRLGSAGLALRSQDSLRLGRCSPRYTLGSCHRLTSRYTRSGMAPRYSLVAEVSHARATRARYVRPRFARYALAHYHGLATRSALFHPAALCLASSFAALVQRRSLRCASLLPSETLPRKPLRGARNRRSLATPSSQARRSPTGTILDPAPFLCCFLRGGFALLLNFRCARLAERCASARRTSVASLLLFRGAASRTASLRSCSVGRSHCSLLPLSRLRPWGPQPCGLGLSLRSCWPRRSACRFAPLGPRVWSLRSLRARFAQVARRYSRLVASLRARLGSPTRLAWLGLSLRSCGPRAPFGLRSSRRLGRLPSLFGPHFAGLASRYARSAQAPRATARSEQARPVHFVHYQASRVGARRYARLAYEASATRLGLGGLAYLARPNASRYARSAGGLARATRARLSSSSLHARRRGLGARYSLAYKPRATARSAGLDARYSLADEPRLARATRARLYGSAGGHASLRARRC